MSKYPEPGSYIKDPELSEKAPGYPEPMELKFEPLGSCGTLGFIYACYTGKELLEKKQFSVGFDFKFDEDYMKCATEGEGGAGVLSHKNIDDLIEFLTAARERYKVERHQDWTD